MPLSPVPKSSMKPNPLKNWIFPCLTVLPTSSRATIIRATSLCHRQKAMAVISKSSAEYVPTALLKRSKPFPTTKQAVSARKLLTTNPPTIKSIRVKLPTITPMWIPFRVQLSHQRLIERLSDLHLTHSKKQRRQIHEST